MNFVLNKNSIIILNYTAQLAKQVKQFGQNIFFDASVLLTVHTLFLFLFVFCFFDFLFFVFLFFAISSVCLNLFFSEAGYSSR